MSTTTTTPAGACDIYSAAQLLWEAAADGLDTETLEWFTGANLEEFPLRNLIDVTEGIAAFIASDTGHPQELGYLQDRGSLTALLSMLAESMRGVAALSMMKDSANDRLRYPRYHRPRPAKRQPADPQQNGTERQPAASRPRAATATSGAV